jgi:hypothetical protein
MNLSDAKLSLERQIGAHEILKLEASERRLEKFGTLAFGGFIGVVSLGVILLLFLILRGLVFSGSNPILGVFLFIFLIFAGLSLAYVFWRESLKDKRKKLSAATNAQPALQDTADAGALPPGAFVPSVVENTTELLPVENRTRKLEN